jgi:hypothetical protein
MSNKKIKSLLIILETIGFLLATLVIWLDELVDLPHFLFGSPQVPARIAEASMESMLVLAVGVGVVSSTMWLFKRIAHLESYIVMCAWCQKIKVENERWITVAEYLWEKDERQITHGLCKNCAEEQMKLIKKKPDLSSMTLPQRFPRG